MGGRPWLALSAIATWLALVAACDERRQAILLCHNANCAGPTESFEDDTIESLRESLALKYYGRPAIDGVELDSLWVPERGDCYFAHDFETIGDDPATNLEAAQVFAEHFAQATDYISWNGNKFYIDIEIKPTVSKRGDAHDAEQRRLHAACVLDTAEVLIEAARVNSRQLELQFDSENIELIRAVVADPRWPGKEPADGISLRLIVPARTAELSPNDVTKFDDDGDGLGIDILSFHTSRLPTGQRQSYVALDVDLMVWMLDASLETFHVLGMYEPKYVVTSEALLFRRWLEY